MLVDITLEIDVAVEKKLDFINDFNEKIRPFFNSKDYGKDVKIFYIGVVCMKPASSFIPLRKPTYKAVIPAKVFKGLPLPAQEKVMSYDLPLDFEIYSKETDLEKRFAHELLNSLDIIKTIKKVKDFEVELFKKDFEQCLQNQGLL
jgi:hypothetical protein